MIRFISKRHNIIKIRTHNIILRLQYKKFVLILKRTKIRSAPLRGPVRDTYRGIHCMNKYIISWQTDEGLVKGSARSSQIMLRLNRIRR